MRRCMLRHSASGLALVAVLSFSVVLPAAAEWHGHDRHWHGDRHYQYRQNDAGAVLGGALLGLGIGAAIGALAAPPPAYAAPPQAYYPPPPAYYGAPPPAYYAPPPPVYYGY